MMLVRIGAALAEQPPPPLPEDLVADCGALDRVPLDLEVGPRGLPCVLEGDLDGDGRDEIISLVSTKEGKIPGIVVRFPDGRTTVIGAGRQTPILRYEEANEPPEAGIVSSIDFLASWHIEARRTRSARKDSPRPRALRGDALWVSGTDAAVLWFFDGQRLCEYTLGF